MEEFINDYNIDTYDQLIEVCNNLGVSAPHKTEFPVRYQPLGEGLLSEDIVLNAALEDSVPIEEEVSQKKKKKKNKN